MCQIFSELHVAQVAAGSSDVPPGQIYLHASSRHREMSAGAWHRLNEASQLLHHCLLCDSSQETRSCRGTRFLPSSQEALRGSWVLFNRRAERAEHCILRSCSDYKPLCAQTAQAHSPGWLGRG